MWHMTCDTWHVTCDMWHMTCDMWHVTCCGGWTFSWNVSSLALTVCHLWYLKIWRKRIADWLNQSITKVFVEQLRLHRVCETLPKIILPVMAFCPSLTKLHQQSTISRIVCNWPHVTTKPQKGKYEVLTFSFEPWTVNCGLPVAT